MLRRLRFERNKTWLFECLKLKCCQFVGIIFFCALVLLGAIKWSATRAEWNQGPDPTSRPSNSFSFDSIWKDPIKELGRILSNG